MHIDDHKLTHNESAEFSLQYAEKIFPQNNQFPMKISFFRFFVKNGPQLVIMPLKCYNLNEFFDKNYTIR